MRQQRMFEHEGDLDEQSDKIVKLRADIAEAVNAGDERRGPRLLNAVFGRAHM
jgi:hypothetical protein